ncbi:very short patch repair endonuclease [Candidatus Dojkabacteria bacterium]|nr:very short patch repair endonuclease [Candidatus Dojkabacteria bacterium]
MILKCNFCGIELNSMNTRHIHSCDKSDKSISNNERKYLFIKYNYPYLSVKENLIKEYETKSLPDFYNEFDINSSQVLFLLDYFNIKKRSISDSSGIALKKYIKTCNDKYDVDNVSQIDSVKEKKKKTFIEHYGVDNIWKSKDFYIWLDTYMVEKFGKRRINNPEKVSIGNKLYQQNLTDEERKKISETLSIAQKKRWSEISDEDKLIFINNCKKSWTNLSEEDKKKRLDKINRNSISSLEIRIGKILMMMNIPFETQKIIDGKISDFLLKNTKILIEIQGDFWHANPCLYKQNDILNHPKKRITANEIWNRDLNKMYLLEKSGYKIIYIWENNMNKMTDEELENHIIMKLLNIKYKI